MMTHMLADTLTVKKLNLNHELVIAYDGTVRERTPDTIVLEARFMLETKDLGYVVMAHNDRFVEYLYTNRWYNIFEVHAAQDDHLKGWYCNVAQPAVFGAESIEQVDLALDLWVNPDGSYHILDQDEFDALDLDRATRLRARQAIGELIYLLYHRIAPFTTVDQPRVV
jgi:protein associated with RNAse G/E